MALATDGGWGSEIVVKDEPGVESIHWTSYIHIASKFESATSGVNNFNTTSSKTARLLNIIQLSSGVCFIRQEIYISTEPICICMWMFRRRRLTACDRRGGTIGWSFDGSEPNRRECRLCATSLSMSLSLSGSETATDINIEDWWRMRVYYPVILQVLGDAGFTERRSPATQVLMNDTFPLQLLRVARHWLTPPHSWNRPRDSLHQNIAV